MPAQKQPCQTLPQWLRENLGPRCLAPLTGTDSKALAAAVQIVALYAYQPSPQVAEAFGLTVMQMQPSCWHIAYHAIAHVMDWNDRGELWREANLPSIPVGMCMYENREAVSV